jgi:hypothetical protein
MYGPSSQLDCRLSLSYDAPSAMIKMKMHFVVIASNTSTDTGAAAASCCVLCWHMPVDVDGA